MLLDPGVHSDVPYQTDLSQVNLGFRLPELDSDTRLQIWRKMLGDLPPSNGTQRLIDNKSALRKWAEEPLNGRQIRNVIHSARLLASPPITGQIKEHHIEDSLQDVVHFMAMIDEEKRDMELKYMSHWSS